MSEFNSLPVQPGRRRVILVLDPVSIDQLDTHDARDLIRRRDVALLDATAAESSHDQLVLSLERRGLLQPGTALIMDPYLSGRYELAERAADTFAIEKYSILSELAQILGAKSLEVEALENRKTGQRWLASAGGGKGPVKGNVSVSDDKMTSLSQSIRLSDRFPGGPPDPEMAINLLNSHNLDHDGELISLIRGRSVAHNPIQSRTLRVDLSAETTDTLAAAATLTVPAHLNLKADLKRISQESARFKVTYTVKF